MRYNRGLHMFYITSQKSTKYKTSLCADALRHARDTCFQPQSKDLKQIAAKTGLVLHFCKHFVTQCP